MEYEGKSRRARAWRNAENHGRKKSATEKENMGQSVPCLVHVSIEKSAPERTVEGSEASACDFWRVLISIPARFLDISKLPIPLAINSCLIQEIVIDMYEKLLRAPIRKLLTYNLTKKRLRGAGLEHSTVDDSGTQTFWLIPL